MSVNRIASRYAKSLLDLSIEGNKLEEVHGDILSLKNALENRDLELMVKSPIVNSSKKTQVFDALFSGKMGELPLSFVKIIIKKGREAALPEIVDAFLDQYRELKKVSTATIISAEPLDAATMESIKSKLLSSSISEDSIELTTKIDPSIIGGYVVKIGDKLYDASVAHKLNKLRKELIS